MKISKDTWHYRVFDRWFRSKKKFSYEKYYGSTGPYGNLCPYVRVVLIWAPLRFLLTPPGLWETIPGLLIGMTIYNYVAHGLQGLKNEGIAFLFLSGIGAATLAVLGILWFLSRIGRLLQHSHPSDVICSFVEVLEARVIASHDKICPQITFVNPRVTLVNPPALPLMVEDDGTNEEAQR